MYIFHNCKLDHLHDELAHVPDRYVHLLLVDDFENTFIGFGSKN